MSDTAILFLIAAVAGTLGGIHVPINGALGVRIDSAVVATLTFYSVGFVAAATLALFAGNRSAFRALAETPAWYYLVPGLISVTVVGANTFLIPRLGALNVFVVSFSASLLVRSVLSHYALFGSPHDPIGLSKVLGAVLLFSGVLLVVRG